MKAVILAGGFGTRICEESHLKPKPMITIGGMPMIWHIMKIYSAAGIHEFIVCLGYMGYVVKEYFANYYLHTSDVTFDMTGNHMEVHQNHAEPWRVTLVDTGLQTMTGGRLKRVAEFLEPGQPFCMTYGDGVAALNIAEVIDFHQQQHTLATVTAAQPQGRFGALAVQGERVTGFREKPAGDGGWVSAGFFVLSPKVIDYIADDQSVWEKAPMERLAAEGQLSFYPHRGFWRPMDTLRDRLFLEDLWASGAPPWKIWD